MVQKAYRDFYSTPVKAASISPRRIPARKLLPDPLEVVSVALAQAASIRSNTVSSHAAVSSALLRGILNLISLIKAVV